MKKILLLLISLCSFAFSSPDFSVCPPTIEYGGQTHYITNDYYSLGKSYSGWGSNPKDTSTFHSTNNNECLIQWQNYTGEKGNEGSSEGNFYFYNVYSIVVKYSTTKPIGCKENESLVGSVCTCNTGYKHVETGVDESGVGIFTCQPKLDCNLDLMDFYATDSAVGSDGELMSFYGCFARTDLSEEECRARGGGYLKDSYDGTDDTVAKLIPVFGEGCVDTDWIYRDYRDRALSFLTSGFLIGGIKPFPMSLASKAVNAEDVQKLLAMNKCTMSTCKPSIKDLVMTPDGVHVEIDDFLLTYKNAWTDPSSGKALDEFINSAWNKYEKEAFQDLLKKSNDWGLGKPSPVNQVDLDPSISSKFDDTVYKGGDELKYQNNMLAGQRLAKDGTLPKVPDNLKIGTETKTKIDLSKYLNKDEPTSYPVTTVKKNEVKNTDGSIKSEFNHRIVYPDGTYTDMYVKETKQKDGSTINDITITTPIKTTGGSASHSQNYQTTVNSNGQTTNVVNNPSTVTKPTESGGTTTSPNSPNGEGIPQQTTEPSVDLSPVNARLDKINNQLTTINNNLQDIKSQQKQQWQYKPSNANEVTTAINTLKASLTDFTLNLNKGLTAINGYIDDFNKFKDDIQNAVDELSDKPSLDIPSGTCPFSITGAGREGGKISTYTVDPCKFISPYKSILTIFFTIFLSWLVIVFSIKYLMINPKG